MNLLRSIPLLCSISCSGGVATTCTGGEATEYPQPEVNFEESMTGGELVFIHEDPNKSNFTWDAFPSKLPFTTAPRTEGPQLSQYAEVRFSEADNTPSDISLYNLEPVPVLAEDRNEVSGISLPIHPWTIQIMGCELFLDLSWDTFSDEGPCLGRMNYSEDGALEFTMVSHISDFEDYIEEMGCDKNEDWIQSILGNKAEKYPELCMKIDIRMDGQ